MKHLLTILAIALSLQVNAQERVQLSGKFHAVQRADSVRLTIWAMGDLIADQVYTGRFYSVTLGSHTVYTIRFASGAKEKVCTVHTANMNHDSVILDVDFSINSEAIIKKTNSNRSRYAVETIDAKGNFNETEYDQPKTGDNRR